MSMPETTMYENSYTPRRQDYIRSAGEFFAVESEAKTEAMKE